MNLRHLWYFPAHGTHTICELKPRLPFFFLFSFIPDPVRLPIIPSPRVSIVLSLPSEWSPYTVQACCLSVVSDLPPSDPFPVLCRPKLLPACLCIGCLFVCPPPLLFGSPRCAQGVGSLVRGTPLFSSNFFPRFFQESGFSAPPLSQAGDHWIVPSRVLPHPPPPFI